ncbi:NAD(P)/FAD-dependent oxidoreductase [Caminibacter profundus]
MYDTIILGAGASGLFLGDLLKKDYLIIEHNSEIGKKIKISGGGKCNITNKFLSAKNYRGNSDFIKKVFEKFDNKDLLNWLEKNNLFVKELKKNQYFFNSSSVLLNYFKKVKNISLNTEIYEIKNNIIYTSKGKFKAKNIVVATGGLSFKSLGASSIGFDIAKDLSHNVIEPKPALVGLTVQTNESWFKKLSGITIFSHVKIGKYLYKDNILFSHRGITGPAILNASLRWDKGRIEIDFLAGKKVFSFLKNPNKQISTQLPLPKRFIKEFLNATGVEDKRIKFLKKEEKEKLKLLNVYSFAPAGTFGFERAEVSKGGVDTREIDEFMRSKINPNVFFIGEVLDVTGELGGYNFQWAFSSAFSAFLFLRR